MNPKHRKGENLFFKVNTSSLPPLSEADNKAFDLLFQTYFADIYALSWWLLGKEQQSAAESVSIDVMCDLFCRKDRFADTPKPYAVIFLFTVKKVYRHLRDTNQADQIPLVRLRISAHRHNNSN